MAVDGAIADLARRDFTDRAESVIVHGGTWEICTDDGYRRALRGLRARPLSGDRRVDRQISSLRRIQ